MYDYINHLTTKEDFIEKVLDITLPEFEKLQRNFVKIEIPKKKNIKDCRIVYKIKHENIKNLYKKLNFKLSWFLKSKNIGFPHECSFGYIRGKSILDNAKQHCNKKFVMKIDIENFFNSIASFQITDKLNKLSNIDKDICKEIATFCCIDNTLPLGLNTSPLISNIVCFDMDKEIHDYCISKHMTYTRYVDDISISSDCDDIISHKEDIYSIIGTHNFTPNEKKFRVTSK